MGGPIRVGQLYVIRRGAAGGIQGSGKLFPLRLLRQEPVDLKHPWDAVWQTNHHRSISDMLRGKKSRWACRPLIGWSLETRDDGDIEVKCLCGRCVTDNTHGNTSPRTDFKADFLDNRCKQTPSDASIMDEIFPKLPPFWSMCHSHRFSLCLPRWV